MSSKQRLTREQYFAILEQELNHRKKWLSKPVRTKRYIRGTISGKIKERVHSRDSGQRTTDYKVRAAAIKKTGGKCYLCWRSWNPRLALLLPKLYFAHLQIDHIVAFSKFGPNTLSNYMPICAQCNNKKSDLSLAEYRGGVKRRRWGT